MENKNEQTMIPLEQAFRFAEWCNENAWKFDKTKWGPAFIRVYDPKTTAELFELFDKETNELAKD